MSICKDCIHYEICDKYVAPNESFPEVEGGCKCFKAKADVVEVVRCKDCNYSEIDENENLWCVFYNEKIREMPNGYCWHGERREENER